MKLIAKRKDYYDHLAKDLNLSDQVRVWKREPKIVDVGFSMPAPVNISNMRLIVSRRPNRTEGIEALGILVFFCGRLIPVVKIVENEDGKAPVVRYAFSMDELPDELVPKDKKTRKWQSNSIFSYCPAARMDFLFNLTAESWMSSSFESPVKTKGGASARKICIDDMHRELGTPVFCHAAGVCEVLGFGALNEWYGRRGDYEPKVVVNPILSAIGLQKVLDPFSAFRDIERYLANELTPKDLKRDMSVIEQAIPDKIKAESHGFDKHSFRKEPTNPTKKRRR